MPKSFQTEEADCDEYYPISRRKKKKFSFINEQSIEQKVLSRIHIGEISENKNEKMGTFAKVKRLFIS